jgi:alkaline phosphatase
VYGDARNIIFLVVDGMSQGTLTMADQFVQRHHSRSSHWIDLYRNETCDARAFMDMAPLNSIVTGSAAASSSWACGHRINNTVLNMDPDGNPYRTICQIVRDAGKATGLVSTARITHATPAGFGINMPQRWMEDEIAAQYLERGYDLLMGGGARHFTAEGRDDSQDLFAQFGDAGYQVIRDRGDLDRVADAEKALGVFYNSHFPYEIDRRNIDRLQRSIPSLAEMAEAALGRLNQHEEGFLLQVEAARVDHAAHSNDTAGLIHDQIAFDDTIATVLDFVADRDDTLLIVTTDHGVANPGLNAIGDRYEDSPAMFDRIANFRRSNEWIFRELDEDSAVDEIQERVAFACNLDISTGQASTLKQAMQGDFEAVYQPRSSPSAVLSALQANYTAVNWTGSMHTSDYVPLVAIGPGSDTLGQFVRNTELFDLMVDTAGVRAHAEG